MNFSDCKVLVIGDVILDTYYRGTVDRVSPEAPVPIVNVKEMSSTLGGATNVTNNIAHLKALSAIIGLVGSDDNHTKLSKMCKENNICDILIETNHPTITKTRILGNKQQIVRLDFEEKFIIDSTTSAKLENLLNNEIKNYDIIVISDYNKGLITKETSEKIINISNSLGKKVIVDPKKKDWELYANAYMVTPNFKEFTAISNAEINNCDNDIEQYGKEVIKKYNINYLLVTRSEKGMSLISKDKCVHFPTVAKDVYDVSGAGDTVVATIATALASGLSVEDSVSLSNKAAGIVVGKSGTSPILIEELSWEFREQKRDY